MPSRQSAPWRRRDHTRIAKLRRQRGSCLSDGVEVENLSDHAGGSDNDVFRRDVHGLSGNAAHFLRLLFAVGVAGVGVAAVADQPLGIAVREMAAGNGDGRALDKILRISARRRAAYITAKHGKVALGFVAAHTAVDPRRLKAQRSRDAAGNDAGMTE